MQVGAGKRRRIVRFGEASGYRDAREARAREPDKILDGLLSEARRQIQKNLHDVILLVEVRGMMPAIVQLCNPPSRDWRRSVRASGNRHDAHRAIIFAQHGHLGEVDRRADVTRHKQQRRAARRTLATHNK